jgi:putative MATE family efflux protein
VIVHGPNRKRLTLLGVAWPLFIEHGLRISIFFVDQLMLSTVSDAAAAGVGTAGVQVLMFAVIIFNFIGIGSSVVITHHLGGGDRAGANRVSAAAMGVNTWSGLAMSALLGGLSPFILRLMGLSPAIFPYARVFLGVLGTTLFLDAQNIAMAATLRAHGRTRDTMLVLGSSNVVNVLGNAIVLFAIIGRAHLAEHGVAAVTGVAISGVVARVYVFVTLRLLVAKRTGVWLRLRDYLSFPGREVRRILEIGGPAAGENLSYAVALMVVTGFAARLGEVPLEVFNYTRSVMNFVILFALSVGLGTEILVGHLIGAGEFEIAYRRLLRSLRTGLLLVGGVTLVIFAARPWIFPWFTHNPAVLQGCAALLLVELVIEPGRVFNIVVINSLRATGDARYPVMMGACSMWGLWVPLAWVLAFHTPLGVTGIWIAMAADEWCRAGMMYWRWRRRGWLVHAQRSYAHVTELVAGQAAEVAENA